MDDLVLERCPTAWDLEALVLGALEKADPVLAERVQGHLDGCLECSGVVGAIKGDIVAGRSWAHKPAPPPDLQAAFLQLRHQGSADGGGIRSTEIQVGEIWTTRLASEPSQTHFYGRAFPLLVTAQTFGPAAVVDQEVTAVLATDDPHLAADWTLVLGPSDNPLGTGLAIHMDHQVTVPRSTLVTQLGSLSGPALEDLTKCADAYARVCRQDRSAPRQAVLQALLANGALGPIQTRLHPRWIELVEWMSAAALELDTGYMETEFPAVGYDFQPLGLVVPTVDLGHRRTAPTVADIAIPQDTPGPYSGGGARVTSHKLRPKGVAGIRNWWLELGLDALLPQSFRPEGRAFFSDETLHLAAAASGGQELVIHNEKGHRVVLRFENDGSGEVINEMATSSHVAVVVADRGSGRIVQVGFHGKPLAPFVMVPRGQSALIWVKPSDLSASLCCAVFIEVVQSRP